MNNGLTKYRKAASGRLPASAQCTAGLLLAQLLMGCGGQGTAPPPDPPPPAWSGKMEPPSSVAFNHGRFVGTVQVGGVSYVGDAIVTPDGQVRLYVGGTAGAADALHPDTSAQFIGAFNASGNAAGGKGIVIAERCSEAGPGRFCNDPAAADFSIGFSAQRLTGELRVVTSLGVEPWRLDLERWSIDDVLPAALAVSGGLYYERLAEFAGDATLLSIDAAGQLFFQSPSSGCTGAGMLSPRLDGQFLVYDVRVTVGSCDEAHASLNAEFSGLASISASSAVTQDAVLSLWLSTHGTQRPVAVTMQASEQAIAARQ